ncbi:MAG: cell division protein ZapA [Blastocatellia bacterium]
MKMENPPQTVNVKIYNQTYPLRVSNGDVDRTLRLAAMVDQRMHEIAGGSLTVDSLKLAVLAAIYMADELDMANTKYEELNEELIARSTKCADTLDQLLK